MPSPAAATRSVESLFAPRSIAIVGASADPMKWGHWVARDALTGADRRVVHLVNSRGAEILGHPSYRSLADLPERPELVVLAVPDAGLEDTLADALAAGARALVVITAGFAEDGPAGRERERAMVARVREAGAVMLGPNCLGVADTGAGLALGLPGLPAGPLGLVCQSGNLALELARLAADAGIGFSRVASIGNQADLDAADLVDDLARHPPTRAIALYVEDFRDGRALAAAMRAAGKPVIVLAAGGGAASARAAASHTGALVSDRAVVDAACTSAGAVRVDSPAALIGAAQLVLHRGRLDGRRAAIVSDGGGHAVIAADLAERAGLEVPSLDDAVQGRILDSLPGRPAAANPVDLAGAGEQDLQSYVRVIGELVSSGSVDAILLTGYFGGYSVEMPEAADRETEVARAIAAAAERGGRPLVVHTMYPESAPAAALRERGVPVYATIDAAVTALAGVAATPPPAARIPPLPPREAPVAAFDYWTARRLLAAAGIPLAPAREVGSAVEALAVARELEYPVALKATEPLHKSDAGGVALGIAGPDELAAAFERMAAIPGRRSVERMVVLDGGVELLIGVRRDARFGPVLAVGLGGVWAEVLDDVAVGLAPIDERGTLALLRSLRGASLLDGGRGREPLDLAAAARAAAGLSLLAAAHPELAAIEVNPLLVGADGAVGLDARIVAAS
jgi:acetate---CoA ligase (ADP-forming)